MGFIIGGTIQDYAQQEILINFQFEPKGTKLKLEQIFEQRKNISENLKTICQSEAERMVRVKFSSTDENGTYVFSRDNEGNYSWQPATHSDKVKGYSIDKIKK